MSNASSTIVKLAPEVTFGTQATTGFHTIGFTSTSLRPTTTYQQDPTIRGTRDIPDLVRLGIGAEGDIGFALRYDDTGALYQLMAAVMQDDSIDGAATQVTGVTASASATVDTQLAASNVEANVEIGDVVRVLNSSDALVGFFEVKSLGTGSIVVYGGSGLSAATNLKVTRGARLKNSDQQKSFTVEVGHPDMSGTDKYEVYTGMVPDRMRLTIADGQMTQGSFSFVGKRLSETRTTTISAGTGAPTTQVMNCVDHVPAFRITSTNYEATEISFEINNASAARTVIGTLGSKSVRSGSFQVTGTIRAYLDDYTEFEKVVNDTESSLLVACRDAAGKAYAFCFPRIKYSQVEAPTTGQDTDVFVTLQWQAVYDSGSACTMRTLFWA